jgi:glycine/D-amino acid oxidase-like deaminating enzyme
VQAVVAEVERGGVQLIYAKADPPAGTGHLDRISTSLNDSISGDQFIYACGPWLPKVFPNLLGNRIHPTRQELFFIGPPAADRSFSVPSMPAWFSHGEPSGAYAIPDIESRGFKLAFDLHGPDIDPDTADRVVSPESLAHARAVLRERFPALANSPIVETRVCQYENTSNGDFLIDRHPDFENVWIAGGGSGHGFKHGPAVGEYVERLLSRAIKPERRFALSMKMAARARAVY